MDSRCAQRKNQQHHGAEECHCQSPMCYGLEGRISSRSYGSSGASKATEPKAAEGPPDARSGGRGHATAGGSRTDDGLRTIEATGAWWRNPLLPLGVAT